MIGPAGVAAALVAHLVANLEQEVDRLANELGPPVAASDEAAAPALTARPALIAGHMLPTTDVGIDDWPFVQVLVSRMRQQRRLDVLDDGSVLYEREYPTSVFLWARGDGYESTTALRDRLTLATAETLLRHQTFGSPDVAMRVREDVWTERYGDVGEDPDLRATVTAALIETVVVAREALTPAVGPLGTVQGYRLDTQRLPSHPALD